MKLSIRIEKRESGGYTAFCPTLPGCVSRGNSKQQAREKLDEAIRGYLAAVSNFVPETFLEEEMQEV